MRAKLNRSRRYPIRELADYYNESPSTLKNACQRYNRPECYGKYGLKSKKVGRDWHAYPADVEAYLKKRGRSLPE